ncbi:ABC transporter permease [Streptomyces indicus]|uniref:Putative ABC transport system permease protein n=1 Tax=Streptomyces indicus TaxID=417292 RepID=A0A1G8UHD6_9ACTN|nr:FtsX-like permease family protein [Streptomyces indicus]SDJ53024.1 putative ABC transport system permease protein [Streptomyces indicus]
MSKASSLLAARGRQAHRRAWYAVVAALVLTSTLLGTFALMIGATALGHARVERYAGAPVVVAGDQTTRYTAKPWGSDPETVTAALTERVRVPATALDVLRKVDGVRAAVPDVVVPVVPVAAPGARDRLDGRPWQAAQLGPYRLLEGRAPAKAGEVVVSGRQGDGTSPGDQVRLRAGGTVRTYTVVGVAEGEESVYFTGAQVRALAGDRGAEADAIGLLPQSGVGAGELYERARAALDEAGVRDVSASERAEGDARPLRVLTGDGRGLAEHLDAPAARSGALEMLASVAASVVLIALLVISSLVAQALRQRAGELALLRAVGAAPRQLRAAAGREVLRVAVRPALAGALLSVPAFLGLLHLLRGGGALPSGLELPTPAWLFAAPVVTAGLTIGAARLTAFFGCARAARIRPALALGEARGAAADPGQGRRIAGVVLLGLGVSSAGVSVTQSGSAAAMAASTAALTMVIGCAVLGPWIARGAHAAVRRVLRRRGPQGRLAAAELGAHPSRFGAAITPIVLVTAFVVVQLGAGTTMQHAGERQAKAALRAELQVTGGADVAEVRRIPGVGAATEILRSTVVVAGKEAGSPRLDRLPVLGVTPAGLTRTLDPQPVEGSLERLGPGTVSVSADRARAQDLHVGSRVTVRFGDGVRRSLKVVAVHERGLAVGEFLFARAELARHVTSPYGGDVLVATAPGADVPAVRERLSRSLDREVSAARPVHLTLPDQALNDRLGGIAVAAIGGFTMIAVLSTLTLIGVGRRPGLRLLRRVGAGRRQVRGMLRAEAAVMTLTGLVVGTAVAAVPLLAFAFATARTLPYLPLAQAAAIAAVVTATAFAGTLLPTRRASG